MRVHSISEVSTNQQQNPYITKNAGDMPAGKNASGQSFKDYLIPYFQQSSEPVVTRQLEHQIVGILWGYCPTLRVSPKPEPKLESVLANL